MKEVKQESKNVGYKHNIITKMLTEASEHKQDTKKLTAS